MAKRKHTSVEAGIDMRLKHVEPPNRNRSGKTCEAGDPCPVHGLDLMVQVLLKGLGDQLATS